MPRFPIWSLLAAVLPPVLHAQQPERYTLADDYVAIYNLVGTVRIEPGTGDVAVQVTRAGGEAASLRIAQGEVDGRSTLRVLYPGDRIRWRDQAGGNSSTQLRVREDGTFGDLAAVVPSHHVVRHRGIIITAAKVAQTRALRTAPEWSARYRAS